MALKTPIFAGNWKLNHGLAETRQYFADHFAGHEVVLGRRGAQTFKATLSTLDSVKVELPWDRLFEVTLEPVIGLPS